MMTTLRINNDKRPAAAPSPKNYDDVLKHTALEAIASVLITYSSAYIPESEADHLKQYVTSLCIFAVIMTLKDSEYFFPDSTPMTTTVLYAATLYTDEDGNTDWVEIGGRITGQLLGYAAVFWLCALNKDNVATLSVLAAPSLSSEFVHAFNEGLGTMTEGIAIAFATIPLISPYDNDDGLQSKAEAFPPDNASLWIVALSLSSIHYTLERVFRGTMNPLVTVMQYYLQNNLSGAALPVVFQCVGLYLAVLYIQWCVPSKTTLKKLRKKR